jgi:hypothetical protein
MARGVPARLVLGLLGAICLNLGGCGPKPAPYTETVEGTVLRGKTPMVGVRVQFVPQVEANVKASISSATTDEKGYFKLIRDDDGKPGAVLGKHKILVMAGREGKPVPKDYSNLKKTPLEVEVTADKTTYPLQIKD